MSASSTPYGVPSKYFTPYHSYRQITHWQSDQSPSSNPNYPNPNPNPNQQ